ncbi:MAG: Thymidylate kinase [candidate division TM6 bacterium GW2011_GWF2_38_10]|nr:MAG: Thymidylate kinase [candidate division TM6 bacterium GW2011_GWF2_38_10]
MKHHYAGKLISLEGIDGSGKSTLAKGLVQALLVYGLPVVATKEFGATPLGERLRTLLHERHEPMCAKTEFLIVAADRAQHFDQIVIPALQAGTIVVSDRMNDSSLAYQGYGRGLDLEMLRSINAWAMNGVKQDIVLFVDIDFETAMSRIHQRNQRLTAFEQEAVDFWHRVRDGYHTLFADRDDVVWLDGTLSPHDLVQAAVNVLVQRGIINGYL